MTSIFFNANINLHITQGGETLESQKLKGVIREKGESYKSCAEAIGISLTTFANKINDKSAFTIPEIHKLSGFLHLSREEKINIFL